MSWEGSLPVLFPAALGQVFGHQRHFVSRPVHCLVLTVWAPLVVAVTDSVVVH